MDKDKQIKQLRETIKGLNLTLYGMKHLGSSSMAQPTFIEGDCRSPFAVSQANKFRVDESGKMWHVDPETGEYITDGDGRRIDAGQYFRNRPDVLGKFRT